MSTFIITILLLVIIYFLECIDSKLRNIADNFKMWGEADAVKRDLKIDKDARASK